MTADTARAGREGRRERYKAVSAGTTLLCVGTILLLNTQDILEWGVWLDLLRLWPVLLISLGIRLLFIETVLHPLCLLGPVCVVLATGWAAERYTARVGARLEDLAEAQTLGFECPVAAGKETAGLELGFEGGRLSLATRPGPSPERQRGEASRGMVLHGDVRFLGEDPHPRCDEEGGLRIGRRSGRRRDTFVMLPFREDAENLWETVLTSSSPVRVSAELERADGEIDLREIALAGATLDSKASSLVVRLGAPRDVVPIRIEGALSRLALTVPESTCFTVTRERRLDILRVEDSRRRTRRRRFVTADSCAEGKAGGPRYEIRYDLPLSYVSVRTEDIDA